MFQLNNWSMPAVASRAALVSLCAATACAPNNAGIALLVYQIDKSVVRLEAKPLVNGKVVPPEIFNDIQGMSEALIGFQLPNAYVGSPVSFQIDAIDSRGCVVQTKKIDISTDVARRYDVKVPLDERVAQKSNNNYFAVHGSSPTNIWAVGNSGAASHWDGCFWQDFAQSDGTELIGVYVPPEPATISPDTVRALAISLNRIYKYQNNNWIIDYQPALENNMLMSGIHGTSATDAWAVATFSANAGPTMGGTNSIIYHRGANGQWSIDTSQTGLPTPNPMGYKAVTDYFLRTIFAVSASYVLVGGSRGNSSNQPMNEWALLGWQIGTWRHQIAPLGTVTGQINSIWGTSQNDYWFGGYPISLRRYSGGTFQVVSEYDAVISGMTGGPMFRTYRISGSSNNNIWINAFLPGENPQSRTIRYDGMWKEDMAVEAISKQITDQYAAGDRDVWLVGYNGKRIHWDGSSLTEF